MLNCHLVKLIFLLSFKKDCVIQAAERREEWTQVKIDSEYIKHGGVCPAILVSLRQKNKLICDRKINAKQLYL